MRTTYRLAPVLAWMSVAVVAQACGSPAAPPGERGASPTVSASEAAVTAGEAAVWNLPPDHGLRESTTKFTALVSRLACNNGVTGEVLAPTIQKTATEVVVTFAVAPQEPGPATCLGNKQVPYEVDLGEPLRDRVLVDGRCRADPETAGTSFCDPSATRFTPSR